MIRLVPMTEDEYREALERAVPRHAANSVRRGQWTEAASLAASRRDYETFHPQGLHTPNRTFVKVINEDDGKRVGEAWYITEEQGGKLRFWVDWIQIDPEYRRRGYATQALEELAREAVRRGADQMGLYVFADNPGAISLYTKLGFATLSLAMVRPLK